jgi:hypothetical protein
VELNIKLTIPPMTIAAVAETTAALVFALKTLLLFFK